MANFDLINEVLDEIRLIHSSLKKGHCLVAKALFLDFCGDVQKLNEEDRSAASSLLWYDKAADQYSVDIYGYYWNNISRQFELVW